MNCNELDFKKSDKGRKIINDIKRYYSTPSRPVSEIHFTNKFLQEYYKQNEKNINQDVLDCYETLLRYWAKDRYEALKSEGQIKQMNEEYETWLNDKSIIDVFGNTLKQLLKYWYIVFVGIIIITLTSKGK